MKQDRFDDVLAKNGINAVILTSPEHLIWAIGYECFQRVWSRSGRVLIVPRSDIGTGRPILVVPISEVAWAVDAGVPASVVTYGQRNVVLGEELSTQDPTLDLLMRASHQDFVSAIMSGLDAAEVPLGVVAVDRTAAPGLTETLSASPSGHSFVPDGESLARWARMVKTEEEILKLKRAAVLNESAIQAMIPWVPTLSDFEIEEVHRSVVELGGGQVQHWLGGTGSRSGMYRPPNGQRTSRGDRWRYDAGIVLEGWCSDLGGTLQVGTAPTTNERMTYEAITAGVKRGIEMAVPGTKASQLYREIHSAVRLSGLTDYGYSLAGHGIGVEPRDWPIVAPPQARPSRYLDDPFDPILESGMVINIEVPIVVMDHGAFQHEVTIAVGDSGSELISPLRDYVTVDG